MGKQLLHANQITGILKANLQEELVSILDRTKYFNTPVATKTDLPVSDTNIDGEMRLVLDEDTIYVWHASVSGWRRKQYVSTERRMTLMPVVNNTQTDFPTQIGIGVADGVIDLNTVGLMINGQWQHPTTDYIPEEDENNPGKMLIKWVSNDFKLEVDDVIYIIYDILKFR
jgi:hypothetical protein